MIDLCWATTYTEAATSSSALATAKPLPSHCQAIVGLLPALGGQNGLAGRRIFLAELDVGVEKPAALTLYRYRSIK